MKRDLWLILILGCLLIVFLEAPAALSALAQDLGGPYPEWSVQDPATAGVPAHPVGSPSPPGGPGS